MPTATLGQGLRRHFLGDGRVERGDGLGGKWSACAGAAARSRARQAAMRMEVSGEGDRSSERYSGGKGSWIEKSRGNKG